jgi:hypothetical protein
MDIHGIFESKPVCNARAIKRGVSVPDHLSLLLGNNVWKTMFDDVEPPPRHFVDIRRIDFERAGAVKDVMGIAGVY